MPSAKFTQTYEKVSKMGEKLKAAGKQGPSNDEQLHVRFPSLQLLPIWGKTRKLSSTTTKNHYKNTMA
jgi:hypothetical protein